MSATAMETEELSVREAIEQVIAQEMERDESVFLQGIDVAGRGGEADLGPMLTERFGEERVRNTPISEVAIVGTGLGAAATGMRPIVEVMYSGFLGVPGDQILNQVAKMRYMFGGKLDIPLTIRTHNTMGHRAGAQHSQSLHNWMAAIPGIKVVTVSTPRDTAGLLRSAIRSNDPVIVFEHSGIYNRTGEVPVDPDFTLPIGQAGVEREGGAVEHQLVLAADLVQVDQRQLALLDPLQGELQAGVLLAGLERRAVDRHQRLGAVLLQALGDVGRPHVLADHDAEPPAAHVDRPRQVARREQALLVEHAVVRQVPLGAHRLDLAGVQQQRGIVQRAVALAGFRVLAPGRAEDHRRAAVGGVAGQRLYRLLGAVEEGGLADQVFRRIAGDHQFGRDQRVRALLRRLPAGGAPPLQVAVDVADDRVDLRQREAQAVGVCVGHAVSGCGGVGWRTPAPYLCSCRTAGKRRGVSAPAGAAHGPAICGRADSSPPSS